jgi:hypothetical protein
LGAEKKSEEIPKLSKILSNNKVECKTTPALITFRRILFGIFFETQSILTSSNPK